MKFQMDDLDQMPLNKLADKTVKLIDAICSETETQKATLRVIAAEMCQTVSAMAKDAEARPQSERLEAVFSALERLETVHCRFSGVMNDYFQLEQQFLLAKRLLCQWESVGEEDAHLPELVHRIEQAEQTYLSGREVFDGLVRTVLPHFLEQFDQLTDGEQNGTSLRLSSLCMLCNEFCNLLDRFLRD